MLHQTRRRTQSYLFCFTQAFSLFACGWAMLQPVSANASHPVPSHRLDLELSAIWQTKNTTQIPNPGGTRFSLVDFKSDADFTQRASFHYNYNDRHGWRFLIFPFATQGTGTPSTDLSFQGVTFTAGVPTRAFYKFHSYRATYRYTLFDGDNWQVRLGVTAKIRNARIALQQGSLSAEKKDLGVVPLFHFNLTYWFSDATRLELDADALMAPQGRAEDVSLFLWTRVAEDWDIAAGYRTLEGGADNARVYTFAWLHFASAVVAYHW